MPSVEPGEESETGGGLTQEILSWCQDTPLVRPGHDSSVIQWPGHHDDHHTHISDILAPGLRQTRGRDLAGWQPSGIITSRTQVRGREVCRAGLAAGQYRQSLRRWTQGCSEEDRTSAWSSLPTSGSTPGRTPPAPAAVSPQTCSCGSSSHLQQQTFRVLQHRHQETDHRLDWLDKLSSRYPLSLPVSSLIANCC